MKNKIFITIVLAILILIGGGTFYYFDSLKPVNKTDENIVFTINAGQSANGVIAKLKDENLIKSDLITKIYVKLGHETSFKQGSFEVNDSMSTPEILDYLSNSKNIISNDVKITFIEGDWVKDMAIKIANALNVNSDELLAYWNDEQVVRSLMDDYPFLTEEIFNANTRYLLEGYLFPDTYYFSPDSSFDTITRRLLDQTLNLYNQYQDAIANSEYSIHELFTLASIVQYEAVTKEDMNIVAGVLDNRMDINMPLQVSVSVCYALDIEKGDDWKLCEVNPTFDSPYNTYMYNGLPPGPIMNFGKDAFEAVLFPTKSNYLFFVADVYGDGGVYYAETYAEHLKNIERFGLGL